MYLVSPLPHKISTSILATPLENIHRCSAHSLSLPASLPLDRSSPDFSNRLNKVLHGQEYERCVRNFRKDDLAWLVDYLDKVCRHYARSCTPLKLTQALDSLDPSAPASRKCMRELRTICGDNAMLPTSYTISPHLLTIDPTPFASGGFGEVHHGTLEGSPVCVKRLRLIGRDALVVATRVRYWHHRIPSPSSRTNPTDVLPRGCDVEKLKISKHLASPGRYHLPTTTRFNFYARRRPVCIH